MTGLSSNDAYAAPPGFTRAQRIFIVDDHPIVRFGIAQLLALEPDLEICGDAADGHALLEKLRAAGPDLVLLDLCLGSERGIDLLHEIKGVWPTLRVLIVSTHDEQLHARQAIRAGACGYVMKSAPPERLVTAVRGALQGAMVLSDALAGAPAASTHEPTARLAGLSERELEIFVMIGRGCHTRAIAEALHLSIKTIESHQFNLRRKLGADSTHHLRHLAYTWTTARGGDPDRGSPPRG